MNVLKKKTKCYIYTRVSTAIEVDGYSLDAQYDRIDEVEETMAELKSQIYELRS